MIIKHLLPALFMLLGFRCYKNLTGTYIFFYTKKIMVEKQNSLQGLSVVFTEFIYLKVCFVFLFFF